jgi:hypothetical protein
MQKDLGNVLIEDRMAWDKVCINIAGLVQLNDEVSKKIIKEAGL